MDPVSVDDGVVAHLAAYIPTLKHWSGVQTWKAKLFTVAELLGVRDHLMVSPSEELPEFCGTKGSLEHQTWLAKDGIAKKLISASTDYDSSDGPGENSAAYMMRDILHDFHRDEGHCFEATCKSLQPITSATASESVLPYARQWKKTWDAIQQYDQESPGTSLKMIFFMQYWPSRLDEEDGFDCLVGVEALLGILESAKDKP